MSISAQNGPACHYNTWIQTFIDSGSNTVNDKSELAMWEKSFMQFIICQILSWCRENFCGFTFNKNKNNFAYILALKMALIKLVGKTFTAYRNPEKLKKFCPTQLFCLQYIRTPLLIQSLHQHHSYHFASCEYIWWTTCTLEQHTSIHQSEWMHIIID